MESYLHLQAKELLYNQIENRDCFEWKTQDKKDSESLIDRKEYRKECILMEFPSVQPHGNYPDESSCEAPSQERCPVSLHRYQVPEKLGYCKCSSCIFLCRENIITHDIVVFWKGNVVWAIEIINTNWPKWGTAPSYPVYLVKAINVMKRVRNSPTYVEEIL